MKRRNQFKLARLRGWLKFNWNEWFLAKPLVILAIVMIGTGTFEWIYPKVIKPPAKETKTEKTTTNTQTTTSQDKPGGPENIKTIITTVTQKKEPNKTETTKIETTKTETTVKEQNKIEVKKTETSKTETDKVETIKPDSSNTSKAKPPTPTDKKEETSLFSFWKIAGLYVLALFFWWGFKSRGQLVVEEFALFTKNPSDKKERKDLQGLGALLTIELDRLKRLYRTVDEQRAVSTATGVERLFQIAFKGEDVSSLLKSAVSSDSKLALGPLTIPAGSIMALLSNIFQGPRISGSLHVEEAGENWEKYTLAAQLVGGDKPLSWDVAKEIPKPPKKETPTFIYGLLVEELAYRIFTDLALLSNTVRWEATRAFSKGLQSYRECLRTSKDSTLNLRRAEHHLMEAISIDEKMDLAYYNLGVVYTELQRHEAAAAAFTKALELNLGRWEAAYGLARRYSKKIRERKDFQKNFGEMFKWCARVRELQPEDARGLNLIGMAYYIKGRHEKRDKVANSPSISRESIRNDFQSAITYFKQATDLAWKSFLKEVRGGKFASPEGRQMLAGPHGLFLSCLYNLAMGYVESAKLIDDKDEKLAKCREAQDLLNDAIYFQTSPKTAPKLRDESVFPYLHHVQGRIYLEGRQYAQAVEHFEKASSIDPTEPFIWVYQAAARALDNLADEKIEVLCNEFLDYLGVDDTFRKRASETIKVLIKEYGLQNNIHFQRLAGIGSFLEDLTKQENNAKCLCSKYVDLKDSKNKNWECAQVAIKLGKLHLKTENPKEAAKFFQAALDKLQGDFPQEIQQQDLQARLAQCQRSRQVQQKEGINILEKLKILEDINQSLTMNPLISSLRKELGCTYFCLCRFAEARNVLEDALFWIANDPEIYHYLGRSYFHLVQTSRDFDQRKEGLKKADEYLRNALALYGSEKTSGPEEVKKSHQRGQTHYWLGHVSLELNRPEPAISSFMIAWNLQEALEEQTAMPILVIEIPDLEEVGLEGVSLEQLFPEPAYPEPTVSTILSPDKKIPPDTQFWLGMAFLKNKNFNEAENLFQELVRKYGSQLEKLELLIKARLYYAFSLAERRGDLIKALQYVEEAYSELAGLQEPQQQRLLAFCNECEGWIHYKKGKQPDVDKAITSLEKAVSFWAEAGSYYRLALAYEANLEAMQLKPETEKSLILKKVQESCLHAEELDFRQEYKEPLVGLRNRLKAQEKPEPEPEPESA